MVFWYYLIVVWNELPTRGIVPVQPMRLLTAALALGSSDPYYLGISRCLFRLRMTTTIYVLMDCWTNVRYVGRTTKPLLVRLKRHFDRQRDNDHRSRWICRERREGRAVGISSIAICDGDGGEEERNWIKYYRDIGCDLVNSSDGGEGLLNPTAIARAHMSEAQRRRPPPTAETRARMSLGQKLSYTPERRERVAEYSRNRPPEVLAKIAYASRHKSASALAKCSAAMIAWHASLSPEERDALVLKIVTTRRANQEKKNANSIITPVADSVG